ncbi:MAG: PP2C family protein-serine/threonine phosphatase [Spirochaetes bacterium]|nr:PP2C family protein-serine/threonine phosphatase [Spirochaetota bacterium]
MLADAEDMLVNTSRDTKRKILVSLNLSIAIPLVIYFFSRLFGAGFPSPQRDLILYPFMITVNISSAIFGLYHLKKSTQGSRVWNAIFSWSSVIIVQLAAVAFLNFTPSPTNTFLFANAIAVLAIMVTGLVINRWYALFHFSVSVASLWYAAMSIGFGYVYLVQHPVSGAVVNIPLTLYIVLWHLIFIITILIIFFESSTIDRIINVIPRVVDKLREAAKKQQQLEIENMRMSTELEIAQRLQTMVLPHRSEFSQVKDLAIAASMDPATEVGGDYYDILPTDDGVYFSIGDVTGHGLSSGVVMLMAQSAFKMALQYSKGDLPDMMQKMNSVLFSNIRYRMQEETNMTMSVLKYQDGLLSICGQHEKVLMLRNGDPVEKIDTMDLGLYVGFVEDISRSLNVMQIKMAPGDIVMLYTDGATEAENAHGEEFGIDRLAESLKKNAESTPDTIIQSVMRDIEAWISGHTKFDDITLVLFKRMI